jgi:hypothetical protein
VADHRDAVVHRAGLLEVDQGHLGVVRRAGDARIVAGVVVVVADQQRVLVDEQDGLEGLHGQGERVAEPVALAGVDATRVLDPQGVHDELLAHEPVAVRAAQVDLVDALGDRLVALEVVPLDEQHRVAAGRERVADDVGRLVGLVRPALAGVLAAAGVELVDPAAARVGVVCQRALDHRVEVAAAARHGLEAPAAADVRLLTGLQVRVGRRLAVRELVRGLQQRAVGVEVQQERAELLAHP